MRRIKLIPALLLCVCLLTSCKKNDGELQRALDFRTALLGAQSCTFSAEVTADFGDKVYDFALDCVYRPQENSAELTVTAPETIAGIQATVDGESAQVRFEDVSLQLGTLADGHVAPMRLPRLLGDAWAYGYIETLSNTNEGCLVTYRVGYDDDELLVYTYFDDAMTPLQAEVYRDGSCVLTAKTVNYSIA